MKKLFFVFAALAMFLCMTNQSLASIQSTRPSDTQGREIEITYEELMLPPGVHRIFQGKQKVMELRLESTIFINLPPGNYTIYTVLAP